MSANVGAPGACFSFSASFHSLLSIVSFHSGPVSHFLSSAALLLRGFHHCAILSQLDSRDTASLGATLIDGNVRCVRNDSWLVSRASDSSWARLQLVRDKPSSGLPTVSIQVDLSNGAWKASVGARELRWPSGYLSPHLASTLELDALLHLATCTADCRGATVSQELASCLLGRYGHVTADGATSGTVALRGFQCQGNVELFARVSVRLHSSSVSLLPLASWRLAAHVSYAYVPFRFPPADATRPPPYCPALPFSSLPCPSHLCLQVCSSCSIALRNFSRCTARRRSSAADVPSQHAGAPMAGVALASTPNVHLTLPEAVHKLAESATCIRRLRSALSRAKEPVVSTDTDNGSANDDVIATARTHCDADIVTNAPLPPHQRRCAAVQLPAFVSLLHTAAA